MILVINGDGLITFSSHRHSLRFVTTWATNHCDHSKEIIIREVVTEYHGYGNARQYFEKRDRP